MQKAEFYGETRGDLPGPLAGVRVLEATTTWAGPMCGCLLADFGADVIKVEHPAGEIARRSPPFLPGTDPPVSFMHATVNRNKRSLCLDLRRFEGRDLFLALARRADIVIENFRPGTMDRWGLGYADLRAVRPDVVYAHFLVPTGLIAALALGMWTADRELESFRPEAKSPAAVFAG